jgi:TP901 family phage tail tape measure protein
MALRGNDLNFVFSLSTKEFLAASKKVQANYEKTKANIEGKPLTIRTTGLQSMVATLAKLSAAYYAVNKLAGIFTDFQTGIANVASLGVENINELTEGVLRVGSETPVALGDLTGGLYEVVSAGVDSANQIDALEISAKAATAGLASTEEALRLGSAVIKGYGKEWSEMDKVMDLAFQTVKLGQTTFGDLASNMGTVVPLASTLGVEMEELFGAMATLTGVTGNTSEVSTQLRGILAATAKPTAELTELFKDYGGASEAIQKLGLAGYLKVIAEETGGNTEAMAKLVPRVEGLNAVIALSGTQYDTFIDKTNQMRDATGAMTDAYNIQSQTVAAQTQVLKNRFDELVIGITELTLPALIAVTTGISSMLKAWNDLDTGTKKLILTMGAVMVALIKIPPFFRAIRTSIQGLYLSMGPGGWLIIGLNALAGLWLLNETRAERAAKQMEAFRLSAQNLTDQDLTSELERVNTAIEDILDNLEESATGSTSFFDGLVEGIKNGVAQMTGNYGDISILNSKQIEELTELEQQYNAINEEIINRGNLNETLTDEQIAQIDKRKDYEYNSQRISLNEYISYLESRQTAVKSKLGEESVEYLQFYDRLEELRSRQLVSTVQEQITEQQSTEVDKRRTYEVESQQLSLAEYVTYLNTKLSSVKQHLGEESAEYKQFYENLKLLEQQSTGETAVAEQPKLYEPTELDAMKSGFMDVFQTVETGYDTLMAVSTDYTDMTLSSLEDEYAYRSDLINRNINELIAANKKDSVEYQKQLNQKMINDRNYHIQKRKLEQVSARMALQLGTELMAAFQGQSEIMFNIGKAASIAQAIINTYEGASRAVAAYPPPFSAIMAAVQIALGMAQVQKIASTNFSPSGFRKGGLIDEDDLAYKLMAPPGEHGIIAARKGEYIINEYSTKKYYPLIKAINEAPRFQEGGIYGAGAGMSQTYDITQMPSKEDLQDMVEAIRDIKIEINSELDGIEFLRTYHGPYTKLEQKRSFEQES